MGMRSMIPSILFTVLLAAAFWAVFGACVAADGAEIPPLPGRVLVAWDATGCRTPHRVAIAMTAVEDDARVARAVPCAVGWMALDVPHPGDYRAEVNSDAFEDRLLLSESVIDIESPVVRWTLEQY